ncbi:hypothetical protein E1176_19930 [Fulvivirga sp. RKSG066]|uniref:hypothetical protein n=1 Tax=Fulvivirga aurantia TaxID=2529383 RepID=UPI0012BC1403|nr:hypothetical protein [Fulvivirga aurantia]MTI23309.1 hypothetical protein [Fulvivirga aurantia]
MHKLILIPLFALAVLQWSFTEVSKYEKAMKSSIEKVYMAKNIEEYQNAINSFERIAQKETDKWEPLYYSAFGYVMISTRVEELGEKDKYLDLAKEKISEASALAPGEDEIVALEGFVHMMRVAADPATRGQQYSGLAMQALNKAVAMDGENPRALYLLGQMEFGTAQFFGSDTAMACEKLQKAVSLFQTQQPESVIAPMWGARQAEAAAQRCGAPAGE